MIRELTIKNYKSILDHTIELGRINVFIGENGCGKTNLLEAVAMAAAALTDKLSAEELFNRGMRVAKPSLMRSSFAGANRKSIVLGCKFDTDRDVKSDELHISALEESAADVKWSIKKHEKTIELNAKRGSERLAVDVSIKRKSSHGGVRSGSNSYLPQPSTEQLIELEGLLGSKGLDTATRFISKHINRENLSTLVGDFAIYNANALALRGLQVVSRRAPLGIYGETLDLAISALKSDVWADLLERAKCISWLENIVVDPADQLKYQGHKLGKSQSVLYFHDKHMRRRNNIFSAENVNEGVLHTLFHLTLFASEGTPKVLGIDNIEVALNPQLCRDLMKQLAELAIKHEKQALITTHNPAVLDGLNLHDEDQRLFVVYRTDEGHTVTKRIKTKPQPDGAKLKLSELWMRGHLGGIPRNF